jgi:hypothetical protein
MQVAPPAEWSPDQCRICWTLPKLVAGQHGALGAVFTCAAGVSRDAATKALREGSKARVVFTGKPGRSLSGLGFQVAPFEGDAASYMPGVTMHFGEVEVKP